MEMGAKAVHRAMIHPNVLGAGAAKRRMLKSKKDKRAAVMEEFHRGTLHSASGEIVTNPMQAVAISYSEADRHAKKKLSREDRKFVKRMKGH